MKKVLTICILLLNPFITLSETSSYDYSSYTASSKDTNLSGQTISSTTSGASAVYITSSGITISNSQINKSGDVASGSIEDSEFYGVNAAILVNGGGLTMTDGSITTSATGGNALVATNGGKVTITGTTISSTGSASARGLHATYGGSITASKVTVSSTGGSCATLATDRGEGTVKCTDCTLTTSGAGSPLIYSTGDITVEGTTGTSNKAQAVVVEGKNTATIKSSTLKCTAMPNNENSDNCGVLIYQSQSGDADSGTSTFTCESSTIEILSSSSYYSSSPMFYVTNTAANIALTDCTFTFGSGTFINIGTGKWGTSTSNGGTVTMTLTNQNIEGNIVVDSISGLTLTLVKSTIKGTINTAKSAAILSITLDADSTITLTGNSYYTSLTNNGNVVTGSYTWEKYDESEIPTSGGGSAPSGSGTPSSSSPPSSSGTPSSPTSSDTTSSPADTDNDDDDTFDTYSSSKNLNICKPIVYSIVLLFLLFV